MRRRRFLWRLYPPYLVLLISAVIAVGGYASIALKRPYVERAVGDLEKRVSLITGSVFPYLSSGEWRALNRLCEELGREVSTRITVVRPTGQVVGDSERDVETMENHATRPEVIDALAGRTGISTRYSDSLRRRMIYVARPVDEDGSIIGVVRVSIPLSAVDRSVRPVQVGIALAGGIVAVSAAVAGLLVLRRISGPVLRMKRETQSFAHGLFGSSLSIPDSEELAGIAETMNHMASQLDRRIRAASMQRSEMEAVLASMVEGVLAVDSEERLLSMNQAAGQLVGVDPAATKGRAIQEVVRNPELIRFIARTLGSSRPVEGDIILHREDQRFLQTHGTVLRDAEGKRIGALVVLNDVTRIRRLEDIRREFVANVVHEIRTPVTSIKGFVETLLDGASQDPQHTKHFLNIIARQTDRLNAVIEDLLSLARIEQDAESAGIVLEDQDICNVLHTAVQLLEREAANRNVRIDLSCDEGIRARINPSLLEQAVVNLIDNAIKYSTRGGAIRVQGGREQNETVIRVQDHGIGIPQEHLPRLFERFYRVDKARSRKLGGTGLGLAIVKHIMQAHNGRATVESTPGVGSIFRLHLPPTIQ